MVRRALQGICILLIFMAATVAFGTESLTRLVTDQMGRQVTVPVKVNKIITTFKPATLCLLSLGLADKLVGVDTSSKRDKLARAVFPGIGKVPGVGSKSTGINFETLVSLEPDLVILYAQKDGVQMADRLESLNIPAIIILPESFETIKSSLSLIGNSVNGGQETVAAAEQMDEILNLIKKRLKTLPKKNRKSGYFASARGVFNTTTGNMLQHEIFSVAGIDNVSGKLTGYFQDISPEQLINWNPDIMVLSQHMKKGEAARLSNRALARISAVSTGQVYRCPSNLAPWDFPSPLSVLASLWLAQKAYPDYFLGIDLKARVNRFHNVLFGQTMDQMGGSLDDGIRIP